MNEATQLDITNAPINMDSAPSSRVNAPLQNFKRSMRGIKNPSHTACHTSSSLQLLYHCFPTLRCALLELSLVSRDNLYTIKTEQTLDESNNELVYHLSHFFDILTHGDAKTATKELSSKPQVRKRVKQPLTPSQQSAVQGFMKRSEYGTNSSDDWKRLVLAMREINRDCYEDVLGKVLNNGFDNGALHYESNDEPIDPTTFYQQLANYTNSNESSNITPIHPSHIADSATVFRSLLRALEFSTKRELERVKCQCNKLEEDCWDRSRDNGSYDNLNHLSSVLERVQSAMKEELSGILVSRIVGTCEATDSEYLQPSAEKNIIESKMITKTILRRTKMNGGIERPIPIPFPLPVVQQNVMQQASSLEYGQAQSRQNEKQYYRTLTSSLFSVTIEPNPIRGYDWCGLIKRGEVSEETFIRKIDASGNEISELPIKEHCANEACGDRKKNMHLDGLSIVLAQDSKKRKDDASVASRSIGVQTDPCEIEGDVLISRNLGGDVDRDRRVEKEIVWPSECDKVYQEQQQSPPPPLSSSEPTPDPSKQTPSILRDKNSLYATAVAVIATSGSLRRNRKLTLQKNASSKGAVASPGTATLFGIEVGIPSKAKRPSSLEVKKSHAAIGVVAENDSIEESTVDSKVSSADENLSFTTNSSGIETPSDIDELSLGSFTDSQGEASQENEAPMIQLLDENDEAHDDEQEMFSAAGEEVNPFAAIDVVQSTGFTSYNASADVDSNDSSSNASSNGDSSTFDSSYTTSNTESSNSNSSSSDENETNNISGTSKVKKNRASNNKSNKQQWTTRKETRFCHPLPKNLIFHLKRFEYSNTFGRVETIAEEFDIPEELELKACCLNRSDEQQNDDIQACCYRYRLSGAIVHVDPMEDEADTVYGEAKEGHYVTFVNTSTTSLNNNFHGKAENQWFELNDDKVIAIEKYDSNTSEQIDSKASSRNQLALQILSGCDVRTSADKGKDEERRYATIVVYSRSCDCCLKKK